MHVAPTDWLSELRGAAGWPPTARGALERLEPGFVTDWSFAADSALWLYRHVCSSRYRTLLECGCGVTSVIIGLALRDRSRCVAQSRCYCLEHNGDWLEKTRRELSRLNLSAFVQPVHAPLVRVPAAGAELFTYDVAPLPTRRLDFVLVDGPPLHVGRVDVIRRIRDRLSPGATVVLDDAGRGPEQQCCDVWVRDCGLQLHGFLPLGHGLALLSARPRAHIRPGEASSAHRPGGVALPQRGGDR
jgi:hypothetical protein